MGYRGVEDSVAKRLVQLAEGVVVEDDVLGIVQRIREHYPNIVVQYCDPARAEFDDAPWRILEECPDGMRRIVFSVWELNGSVLERLQALDTQKHDVLALLDKNNRALVVAQQARFRQEREELSLMVADTLRSPKDTYTATNPVTGEKHTFTATRRE